MLSTYQKDDLARLIGTVLVGFGIIYAIFYLLKYLQKKSKFGSLIRFRDLPSPKSYPILGHLSRLGDAPHVTLTKWSEEFGSLYRIKMGLKDVLIVSGLKTIRTALMKNSIAFAGRPRLETTQKKEYKLAFADYSLGWVHEKGIAKAAINLYTTGKDPTKRSVMETGSFRHANKLVDQLIAASHNDNGKINPENYILANATNAISEVCFDRSFEFTDPAFKKLLLLYKDFDEALGVSQTADFWPILKYLPFFSRPFQNLKNFNNYSKDLIMSALESNLQTYDENNARDLIDCLYNERLRLEKIKDEQSNINSLEENIPSNGSAKNQNVYEPCVKAPLDRDDVESLKEKLAESTTALFQAGFDTFFTMIYWSMIYFAVYPETQEKVHEEIVSMISPDEQPSFREHASKCHYTVAWIYELMRHVSPMPLLLPHSTTQQVELENCILPPHLTVYLNVYQVHFDPKVWDNPQEFNPERFLDKDTQAFKQNIAANVLSWGIGKRLCPGKDLSKHEMFIFICTIVRRLKIKPSRPGIEPTLPWPSKLGISLKPKPFKIEIEER